MCNWQPQTTIEVSEFIDRSANSWSIHRVVECVDPSYIPLILSLWIAPTLTNDGYCWQYTTSSKYIVKLRYEVARQILDAKTQLLLQLPSSTIFSPIFGHFSSNIYYISYSTYFASLFSLIYQAAILPYVFRLSTFVTHSCRSIR